MKLNNAFSLLRGDKLAFAAAIYLAVVVVLALIGPELFGKTATAINLRARNLASFDLSQGWQYILGSDSLGRSVLARIMVGARNTIGIAFGSVIASLCIGGAIGIIAGLSRGALGSIIVRSVDVIMSFPSLLLALIVLYVMGPDPVNIIVVLAITRLPVYIRTARAEVLEIRERAFVSASRVMGASGFHIAVRHIVPLVLPTLLIIAALDFAYVMLAESALSFLGIGVQPPDITWGLMVAEGRGYINVAWSLSFWPGLAIMLTAIAANLLASWFRLAADPTLAKGRKSPDAAHA